MEFKDQPQYLQDYTLNQCSGLQLRNGSIAILDIRNLWRQAATTFALDRVPIVLSITGIYLRVATLIYFADAGRGPWYQQVSIP